MKIQIKGKPIWVNYHHLYCFWVVASEGGLSKASKKLGIGQSALSIQIKQFENSIGFQIFERSHKNLKLNDAGLIMLSYAKEIFRLGSEMMESLYDQPSSNRIHLQIGALDTIPKHLTLRVAKAALDTRRCTVSIQEGKPNELFKDLVEHRIDLVLTNSLPTTQEFRIYHKRIARLHLWVVGTKKFLGCKTQFPYSLNHKPMIVPTSDSAVRHEANSFFKKNKIQPDEIAEVQDVMVQKLLALEGIGLTIVPEFAVKEYVQRKELYLIGSIQDAYEELYLVSASRKVENPIAAELMKSFEVE